MLVSAFLIYYTSYFKVYVFCEIIQYVWNLRIFFRIFLWIFNYLYHWFLLIAILHAIQDPSTGYFVNIRPGWDDLKGYLITASGRQRFKVYVCTMAGRDYALEIWRLLDPDGRLISLNEISQRLICVRPGKIRHDYLLFSVISLTLVTC